MSHYVICSQKQRGHVYPMWSLTAWGVRLLKTITVIIHLILKGYFAINRALWRHQLRAVGRNFETWLWVQRVLLLSFSSHLSQYRCFFFFFFSQLPNTPFAFFFPFIDCGLFSFVVLVHHLMCSTLGCRPNFLQDRLTESEALQMSHFFPTLASSLTALASQIIINDCNTELMGPSVNCKSCANVRVCVLETAACVCVCVCLTPFSIIC